MIGFSQVTNLITPTVRAFVFLSVLFVPMTRAKADALEAGKFTLGIFSSIVVHELGHAAAMEVSGGHARKIELFNNGPLSGATYSDPTHYSKRELQLIDASGLLTTSLATEVIIQNQNLHDKSLAQGMLAANLITNISYVYNFYTKRIGENGWYGNDIDNYERDGGNPNLLNLLLIAHTAFSIYRINYETDIVPYAKKNVFGISFKF